MLKRLSSEFAPNQLRLNSDLRVPIFICTFADGTERAGAGGVFPPSSNSSLNG